MGQTLTVDGPVGDFWLRPGSSPLMLIAGGSGLAPMLALLKDAANQGVQRSVTLLFGARAQQDLYALDDIEGLSQQWAGRFRFLPVLSAEPADSNWAGARGLVSDQIPQPIEAGSQVYLCGPPAMIDHAMPVLTLHGVRRADILPTGFRPSTTPCLRPPETGFPSRSRQRSNNTTTSETMKLLHYLKYFLFHAIGLLSAAAVLAGGAYITIGLIGVLVIYVLGDALCGDDTSTPSSSSPAS